MSDSILLVVDIQKGEIPYLKYPKNLISEINNLIEKAERKNMPVIFTQQSDNEKFIKRFSKALVKKGTDSYQFAEGIKIGNKTIFFEKSEYSIFTNKLFTDFLKHEEVKKIYICGVFSHVCVLAASLDAFTNNYEVFIIKDAVGTTDLKHLKYSLHWMEKFTSSLILAKDF